MRVPPKILFQKAYGEFCIPAFNVSNPEQVMSLFSAANKYKSPFIIQTTPVAREYINPSMLLNYIKSAERTYKDVIYSLHLDHGNEKHVLEAIDSDTYDSIMIDASHDPIEKNIQRTSLIVNEAQKKSVFVEAELGVLSGVEDDLNIDDQNALYTDPQEAERFVKETRCDSLAVAIGTSHGAYKFSGGKGLRFDLLEEIQRRLPKFPIVLHGASQIDQSEVNRINKAGGTLSNSTKGVSIEDIKYAVKLGVCKLNIATDLRLLWTRIFREFFRDNSGEWDHLKPGKAYMMELESLISKKFQLLNVVGKAKLFY